MNTKRELLTFIGLVATYIAAVFLCAFLAFDVRQRAYMSAQLKKGTPIACVSTLCTFHTLTP